MVEYCVYWITFQHWVQRLHGFFQSRVSGLCKGTSGEQWVEWQNSASSVAAQARDLCIWDKSTWWWKMFTGHSPSEFTKCAEYIEWMTMFRWWNGQLCQRNTTISHLCCSYLRATIFQQLGLIAIWDQESNERQAEKNGLTNFVGKNATKFRAHNHVFEIFIYDLPFFIKLLSSFIHDYPNRSQWSITWGVSYLFQWTQCP